MKKGLKNYSTFINESMFGQNCDFLFIPVDRDFNCLISDLTYSTTPMPSKTNIAGVAGFVMVPAFLDTKEIINSPYMNMVENPDISGRFTITDDHRVDGKILINYDPNNIPPGTVPEMFKAPKKTATIPGFSQNYGFYFKSGSAWVIEALMKEEGWEEESLKNASRIRKRANGYDSNVALHMEFFQLEDALESIQSLFGASSSSFGYRLSGATEEKYKNRVSDLLLDLFKKDSVYFMSLNIDKGISDQVIERAKETEDQNTTETIDNLSTLKDSGFFDD